MRSRGEPCYQERSIFTRWVRIWNGPKTLAVRMQLSSVHRPSPTQPHRSFAFKTSPNAPCPLTSNLSLLSCCSNYCLQILFVLVLTISNRFQRVAGFVPSWGDSARCLRSQRRRSRSRTHTLSSRLLPNLPPSLPHLRSTISTPNTTTPNTMTTSLSRSVPKANHPVCRLVPAPAVFRVE